MLASAAEPSTKTPSVGATLLLLVGVVPFMAGLFGLYGLLKIGMPFFGLLFLLYWAAILRQEPRAYPPSVLGGLAGILLGWLLVGMPPTLGLAGTIFSYAALAAVLFCFMRGQARLVVNNATMLFLAVATIPELSVARNAVIMAESLTLAATYMGLVAVAMHLVTKLRDRGQAARAGL